MKSKMEKVVEEIALDVLRNVAAIAEPPLRKMQLERSFLGEWPADSSRFPINDAMKAAVNAAIASGSRPNSGWNQGVEGWKTPIADTWDRAVSEAVDGFFEKARECFDKERFLEGTETLTDAVRVTLGDIAAQRGWPHGTDDDLYRAAAALATDGRFPGDSEDLYVLLENASEDGMDLCGALGASMGRPETVMCGLYGEEQTGVGEDAQRFARMTITKARSLAGEKAVAF